MTGLISENTNFEVIRHVVDWDDPHAVTLKEVTTVDFSRHPDAIFETCFRKAMRCGLAACLGTRYINPMFTVSAPCPSTAFFARARQARQDWRRALCDIVSWSSSRWREELHEATPIIRQLKYTGVMFVEGRHIQPTCWPNVAVNPRREPVSAGQAFGRLTIVAPVKGRRWLCRCVCGKDHVVREQHLVSGSTKSCGCLKTEHEARQQKQKRHRARN